MIKLKRAYDKPSAADGVRILVERLWPRGVSKDKAALDLWLKDVAPSPRLRQWFNHDSAKWAEFQKRYVAELKKAGDVITLLKHVCDNGPVTFVYAASDPEHNSALLLRDFLERLTK